MKRWPPKDPQEISRLSAVDWLVQGLPATASRRSRMTSYTCRLSMAKPSWAAKAIVDVFDPVKVWWDFGAPVSIRNSKVVKSLVASSVPLMVWTTSSSSLKTSWSLASLK